VNSQVHCANGSADANPIGKVIALGAGLVALALLFQREIFAAINVWRSSTAYNHCFLVIPVVCYLLYDRRDALRGARPSPYPSAIIAGAPLAIVWLAAERIGVMEGRQLVAMSFVELLLFVALGPRLWWMIAGPLLFLYFLVPFGAFLTSALQDGTTAFVAYGLSILHIPVYTDGYTIEIPEGDFQIAEACSGLRFLIAAVVFGCLYALLMYRSVLRRAMFIGLSIIVPILANGVRALGIIAFGHYVGDGKAALADHVLYGWTFFSIVILVLITLGLPFRQDMSPRPKSMHPQMPPRSMRHSWHALIEIGGVVALAAAGPAAALQLDRPSSWRTQLYQLSTTVSPTSRTDRAETFQRLDLPIQMVAGQRRLRACTVIHEYCRSRQITDHSIVTDHQRSSRILRALEADGDHSARVIGVPSLLQPVASHEQIASIWDVDQVAGITVLPIGDVIVDEPRAARTRFDVMSGMLVDEARMIDLKRVNAVGIDTVRTHRSAFAVAAEKTVGYPDDTAGDAGSQNAIFVVDEAAVLDEQIASLCSNACSVPVRYRSTCKGQVLHSDIVAEDYEDTFARTYLVGDYRSDTSRLDG
jgi:exosortase A